MKALIIGAGAQGGPAATILSKQDIVTKIILGDINLQVAEHWKEKIGSDKVQVIRVDASDPQKILEQITDTDIDVVFDFTAAEFSVNVMKASIELKAHYVNTAASDPHLDDFVIFKDLLFEEEFRKNNKSALLGCGESPGIVNVIIRDYCDRLDTVKSIKIKLGYQNEYGEELLKVWRPTWSPAQQLFDFSYPSLIYRDGNHQSVPLFGEPELYDFGGDIGKIMIAHHAHDETFTLPLNIKKGIQYCDFKYPSDPVVAIYVANGLTSQEEIEVKGVKIKPRDFLLAITPKPADNAVNNIEENIIHLIIEGTIGSKRTTFTIETYALTDQGAKAMELFGVANIAVPYSAVAGGLMLLDDETKKGIVWPEELDPKKYYKTMDHMGLKLSYKEIL